MNTLQNNEALRLANAKSILTFYNIRPTYLASKLGFPAYKLTLWMVGAGSISYEEYRNFVKACNKYFLGRELWF